MSDEPYELNRRIRSVQAELDDIDRLHDSRLSHLRSVIEERLDSLLAKHPRNRKLGQPVAEEPR